MTKMPGPQRGVHGEAELIGSRLIVWDHKAGLGIYRSGFFGKPVTGS